MIFLILLVTGCGVKGKPLPPLEPVMMGNGQLRFEKTAAESAKKAKAEAAKTAHPSAEPFGEREDEKR